MEMQDLNTLRSIEELNSYLGELRARAEEIDAEYRGLELSAEATEEFANVADEIEKVERKATELERRARLMEKLRGDESNAQRGDGAARIPAPKGDTRDLYDLAKYRTMHPDEAETQVRSDALRAVELARFPVKDEDAVRGHISRLVEGNRELCERIIATGNPVYERAFWKHLVGRHLSAEEQRVMSIYGGSNGDAGGLAVPFTVDPTIITLSDGSVNPLRRLARVVNITGNEWRGIAADAVVASYDPELTETSDDSPSLSQPVIHVEKAQAFIPFSIEIGEDWGGFRAEMARLFADAKDDLEAEKFLTGAGHGSTEPEGLLVGATETIPSGPLGVADIFAVVDDLPPRYESRASILASSQVFNLIRQLGDDNNSNFWADLRTGTPNGLIGYPTYKMSTMAATAGPGDVIMVAGDFSRFVIVDRTGLNVELVPHLFGTARNYPNGSRGLYCYWRNSSGVVDANAFRVLLGSTS